MPMRKECGNIDGIKCYVENKDKVKGKIKNLNIENGKFIYTLRNYTNRELTHDEMDDIINDEKNNIGKNNFLIKKHNYIKTTKEYNKRINNFYNNLILMNEHKTPNEENEKQYNKTFMCVCGQKIKLINKLKHKRNKHHLKYMNEIFIKQYE
jgi:hypothetical protein